jgi:uncharacterized protein YyaL (SSP411 family)
MIAACARAARVLEGDIAPGGQDARTHFTMLATRAASFVRRRMWDPSRGLLLRREPAESRAIEGFAEDYACLVWGLLELFQTTGQAEWLAWAVRLQQAQDALFWDPGQGGWFSTTGRDPSILLRMKEDYDGAEPGASSVSVLNLLVLAHLVEGHDWPAKIERTLARLGPAAGGLARQLPLMLAGLATWHAGLQQIVIVGNAAADDTAALRQAIARHYLPFSVVVPVQPGEEQEGLAALLPWIGAMTMRDGRATAYVCRNFACDAPVISSEDLEALLASLQPRAAS